jgi:predicted helicase
LLESFDKIYILDLHGNAKKKEVAPDGSPDQNVFDIMQGVSINMFIKTGKKKDSELGEVFHYDLQGKRDFKYDCLSMNSLKSIKWNKLHHKGPNFYFVNKNFKGENVYLKGFKITELFDVNSVGIVTSKDEILINDSKDNLIKNVEAHYNISCNISSIKKIAYRTFDTKFIYYDVKIIDRARDKVMKHLCQKNLALIAPKQAIKGFKHVFMCDTVGDKNLIDSAGQFGAGNVFPLYLYPEISNQQTLEGSYRRTPNFKPDIVKQIADGLGMTFTNEKEEAPNTIAPIDLLDYIYAVLHSPSYREKYKEFLKIDFPRVPNPTDADQFWKLVCLGGELRQVHLLENPIVEKYITQYPEDGDNIVTKPVYKNGNVYINDTQYFANVPEVAWNFYIGGYQPAQKWLKDRKGRELGYDDILHYQKIIVAMCETDRVMKEIDTIKLD